MGELDHLSRFYAVAALRELALNGLVGGKGLKMRIELIEAGDFDQASEVRAVRLALEAVEGTLGLKLEFSGARR